MRWIFEETNRAVVPYVFSAEPTKGTRRIGFDRPVESGIEVVKYVPVEELRRYKSMVDEKRKGAL